MPENTAPGVHREHRALLGSALLASLILSLWCVYADPVVNNDGILYLRAAQALAAGRLGDALEFHHWPLYPALIAAISAASTLPVEPAAHALNAVLVALMVWAFLSASYHLGADRVALRLALLVVLLFPGINKYRSFVVRDTGYLMAYFWWLAFLVRYWRAPAGGAAGMWLSAALAFLFRVEGLAWLLLTPVAMVWQRAGLGSRRAMPAAALAGGVAVAVGGWWLSRANPELMKPGLLRALTDAWYGFGEQLQYRLLAIREEVLGTFSQKYAWWVLVITLLVVVVSETLRRLTLVHAGLAWFGYAKGHAFPFARFRPVWLALIVTQLLVLLLFAFLRLFLVDRYTVALGLTVALAVPFALAALKRMREQSGATVALRLAYPLAIALVLLIGVEALDVRTDKKFLKEAGRWIAAQTAPDSRVYANNQALAWYTGREAFRPGARYDYAETLEAVRSQLYREYDWLAVVVGRAAHEENRLRALLGAAPEQTFSNPRGDKVLIFRVRQ